jgi:hypothetical protein
MNTQFEETIKKMQNAPRRRLDEMLPGWLLECTEHKTCRRCVRGFEKRLEGDGYIFQPNDVLAEVLPVQEKLFGVDKLIATAERLLKETQASPLPQEEEGRKNG